MEREADEPNQQTLNEQCMLTFRDGVQVAKAAIVFYNLLAANHQSGNTSEACATVQYIATYNTAVRVHGIGNFFVWRTLYVSCH
eukprot:31238-Pelagococcus_subviridis.AAC.6